MCVSADKALTLSVVDAAVLLDTTCPRHGDPVLMTTVHIPQVDKREDATFQVRRANTATTSAAVAATRVRSRVSAENGRRRE